ncbi:alginate lyase family protein [Endozoicomonas sp. SM1973]|uniref:Alginate lyase family protein n=1 Tax=Spartinivicinus marinus TaxID=2994442 RepID=A0A853IAG0_9GAMM|nr:heparinase II/III family protein [Spartinivicinus marinus]MCX4028823.1 alginate lyase family protein [Spartinivicinus marinus]NYZ67638.1 alginate lyase family protein [Spartinivicinus marinus]
MTVSYYFYTLRYLKIKQLVDRFYRKVRRINQQLSTIPAIRQSTGKWLKLNLAQPSMLSSREFIFLNKRGKLLDVNSWNDTAFEKLWLYNLHYFEDLVAIESEVRKEWHLDLISSWINDNPVTYGNGWEPYPTSLRVVNWIKWFFNGQMPEPGWLHSLALQAKVLSQSLEYHLLGNHLFANSKALIFAGIFFEGDEPESWLKKGLEILDTEIKEQVLADGGNFELSPMYHNIMLYDLLDLINISQHYIYSEFKQREDSWRLTAEKMLVWMNMMLHQDGDIAFFNDSVKAIAPSPDKLKDYALKLNIKEGTTKRTNQNLSESIQFCRLADSGYLRLESKDAVAILDCAKIGPDYQPGHAHADTLSFELSLFGQRTVVNSGISQYGETIERLRQRSTAAHSTVEIDGENSSEVWAGFRVARRARPCDLVIKEKREIITVSCIHDGYRRLPGRPIHKREWIFTPESLAIVDNISGQFTKAIAYYYLHPNVKASILNVDSHVYKILLKLENFKEALIKITGSKSINIVNSYWYPEFSVSIPNQCIQIEFNDCEIKTKINW